MKEITYTPSFLDESNTPISVVSAWVGLEKIIRPMVKDFSLNRKKALEIGVDHGYSLSALSNVFDSVVGVDLFRGDHHAGSRSEDQYQEVLDRFKNDHKVTIVRSSYQDYFDSLSPEERYDFIHVDIVHDYQSTYDCGLKALSHSDFVVFHDTESFPDVRKACLDLSMKDGLEFYNYPHCNGLGILMRAT